MKIVNKKILVIGLSILTLLISIFFLFSVSGIGVDGDIDIVEYDDRLIEIRDRVYDIFVSGVDIYSNNAEGFIDSGDYDNVYYYYYESSNPYLINNDAESGSHKEYARDLLKNIDVGSEALEYFNNAYMYSIKLNELECYAMHLACEYYEYDANNMPGFIKDSIWFDSDDELEAIDKYDKALMVINDMVVDGYSYSVNDYRNMIVDNMNNYKNSSVIRSEGIECSDVDIDSIFKYDVGYSVVIVLFVIAMIIFEFFDDDIVDKVVLLFCIVVLFVINRIYLNVVYRNVKYSEYFDRFSFDVFNINVNFRLLRYLFLLVLLVFVVYKFIVNRKNIVEIEVVIDNKIKNDLDVSVNNEEVVEEKIEIPSKDIDTSILNSANDLLIDVNKHKIIDDINELFDSYDESYDVIRDNDDEIRNLFK